MNFWVKALLGLAVALPLGGYVVGSLAASAEDPSPRETIVIRDTGASTGPAQDPSPRKGREDDDARRGDDRGSDDLTDDDEAEHDGDSLETVVPEPEDLDDDRDDREDSSGPGPNSGPGGDDTDDRDDD